MSKFVTINYYPHFSYNNTTVCYGDEDYLTPFKTTLNIDSIMSIADKPRTLNVYKSYKAKGTSLYTDMNVHLLETNAGIGCGINGIDFKFYFITEESYSKLMSLLDPVQCA